jgi:hypothetical protein
MASGKVNTMPGRRYGLIAAGLVGGVLSSYPILSQHVVAGTGPGVEGLWFGLALGAYFLLEDEAGSLGKMPIIAVASVAALWVAFLAAGASQMVFFGQTTRPDLFSLFVGGAVGGVILGMTTIVLYGRYETRVDLFRRILACGIGGGVLGVAGYMIGDAVQPGRPSHTFSTWVLLIVWQTGLASVMTLVWPAPDESAAPALPPSL